MHSNQTRKVSERKAAGLHMLHTAIAKAMDFPAFTRQSVDSQSTPFQS